MDFNDSQQEAEFRKEAREFLEANAEKRSIIADKPNDKGSQVAVAGAPETVKGGLEAAQAALENAKVWQKKKADAGFAAILWPKEFGGYGGSPIQQVVYSQEEHDFLVPSGYFEIGIGMLGPTMMVWGKDEDKKRYLPKMITGEEIWCQLFSEPGSGSDLASLSTKAVDDGDGYLVNGQKVWTTLGHLAKWGLIVTRTDPNVPKHRGLTFFIVDMESDGVDVRPVGTYKHYTNEQFDDDSFYDYLHNPSNSPNRDCLINYINKNRHNPDVPYPLTYLYYNKNYLPVDLSNRTITTN